MSDFLDCYNKEWDVFITPALPSNVNLQDTDATPPIVGCSGGSTQDCVPPGDADPCDLAYANALNACNSAFPDSADGSSTRRRVRSAARDQKRATKRIHGKQAGNSAIMSDLFDAVDKDSSGHISLAEYLSWIEYVHDEDPMTSRWTIGYVKYFKRYVDVSEASMDLN